MKLAKGEYELPEGAVDVLKNLTEDRKNDVWLLSGLPVRGALEKVAELVPKVGIVYVFLFLSFRAEVYERWQRGEWMFHQDETFKGPRG